MQLGDFARCVLDDRLTGDEVGVAQADLAPGRQAEELGLGNLHEVFALDPDSAPGRPVFNRTITLKDTWAKVQAQNKVA